MSDREQLPPSLEDFGRRLHEAAHREVEADLARPRRRLPAPRTLLAAALAILLPAGAVAGAGALLNDEGPPIREESELPPELAPARDPGVLTRAAVPDPDGGAPWTVKVFTNRAGQECIIAGQLRDGRLGQFHGRTFRPYPKRVPGACGSVADVGLVYEMRRQPDPDRTLVFGISAGRSPVRLRVGDQVLSKRPQALGAFIFVLDGLPDPKGMRLSTTIEGRPVSRRLWVGGR